MKVLPFVVGVSGLARSGKNLFSELVRSRFSDLRVGEFSFASQLRSELAPFVKKSFGLDVWTQNTEEKTLLRDIFTSWADLHRKQTNGSFYFEKLRKSVLKSREKYDLIIITDLRFKEYEYDEVDFVKSHGVVVHVSKYDIVNNKKVFQKPPNRFEKENDPKIKALADFRIQWPNFNSSPYTVNVDKYVCNVLEGINKKMLLL